MRTPRTLRALLALGLLATALPAAAAQRDASPRGVDADAGEDSLQGLIEKTVPLRTHTLYSPYVDQDLQNRWWDFGADAVVNTAKHVRLTQDKPSQMGWLWSRLPLMPRTPNWQVDVEFQVDGKSNGLYGDGFAMWVIRERAQPGPVFGSVDAFTGLGVFFDTYPNTRHSYTFPRVTAMMGDGTKRYDHDNDNEAHELAACSVDFRRRDVPTKLRLTYIAGKFLQLKLHTEKEDQWDTCFELDAQLPSGELFLGFSALTGEVSDAHDIVSVSSYSAVLHEAPNISGQADIGVHGSKAPRKRRSSGGAVGWFLFLLKAIGVLAFVAFAFSAWRTYDAQRKGKRF